jgi:hypothetical protein
MRKAASCALGVLALLAPCFANAQGCPAPAGGDPKLASIEPMARLSFLHDTLDRQALYAQIWTWSWSAAGAGLAWGNFIMADRASNSDDRTDYILAGAFSVLIPVSVHITNLRVMRDAPVLDSLMAGTAGGTTATCLVLARAEELIARDAADEDFHAGWLTHVLTIAGNGVLFGIVGALHGLDHWGNAWLDLLGGIPVSELQILTQPTGAARAWKHYRAGTFDVPRASAWRLGPLGAPGAAGVALQATF